MPLKKEFIQKHILPLTSIPDIWNVKFDALYQLDLRMCFIQHLTYGFEWGDERCVFVTFLFLLVTKCIFFSSHVIKAMPITEQPSRIMKLDISLNDIRFIDEESVNALRELRCIVASVNQISKQVYHILYTNCFACNI